MSFPEKYNQKLLKGRKRERGKGREGEDDFFAPLSPSPPFSLSPSHAFYSILLVGVLTLSACSAITSEEPPIADSTMVEVLIELHLADARLELQYNLAPAVRDSILFKDGLDEQHFRAILDYYADNPEAYSALYTTVLDRISDERLRQGEGLPLSTTPPPGVDDRQRD